jgi:hypothetical protein
MERTKRMLALFAGLCMAAAASAAPLPQYADDAHMGPATCASGVCHGSVTPLSATNVMQDEYTVWTQQDAHAGAYDLLLNDQSRRIARNLGLANAHEADICLDCHADNVPDAKRGPKFQISDGVGCEACHGGAERWIESHTADGASHADNIAKGLYPSEDPAQRAQLCLSCHLGNDQKFATHRIMGAGHPRLAFELDTFSVLQPPHYLIDDDYASRKGAQRSFRNWTIGLVTAARGTLDLIQGPRFTQGGVFPEIALFDCHACHHAMSDQRWQPSGLTGDIGPGVVRLTDANFLMLFTVADAIKSSAGSQLRNSLLAMHKAVAKDRNAVVQASRGLDAAIDALAGQLDNLDPSDGQIRAIVKDIFERGAKGDFRDYVAAEQATMAVDLLLVELGMGDAAEGAVGGLYSSVENEDSFDGERFKGALAAVRKVSGI